MKKINYLVLITSSVLIWTACSKENSIPAAKTTKELLIAHNWVMSAYTVFPVTINGKDTISDFYAELADCDKDGYVRFTNNDTIIYDNGTVKCLPNEKQDSRSKYVIVGNGFKEFFSAKDSLTYSIVTLNDNLLVYTTELMDKNKKQLHTLTLKKK